MQTQLKDAKVIWVNEEKETGAHFDLKVQDKMGKLLYCVEVKSTNCRGEPTIPLSMGGECKRDIT